MSYVGLNELLKVAVELRADGEAITIIRAGFWVLWGRSKRLCVHRQQIQHYTNQLAKETNKHLKELGSTPLPTSPSEQVSITLPRDLLCHVRMSCDQKERPSKRLSFPDFGPSDLLFPDNYDNTVY